MPCTTILVGKKASYDGSTLMARNEDSSAGEFTPKKWIVVNPADQPRHYRSVLSSFAIDLPEDPMRYTAMPNALPEKGIWGEAGFNEAGVAMSETETITSNARVLGADPLVPSGIGEEDMLTLVLPYIKSAREGVKRLGSLLEQYGTYEKNGIGFQDQEEIWWFESIGGHHYIAKKVPDDSYVVMPNQQGIDRFDLRDAFSDEEECMCSPDLLRFIEENHLDLSMEGEVIPLSEQVDFDARAAFGSKDDADHTYNTCRAWFMLRTLNPRTCRWDGPDAAFTPESDDLPWCMIPEKKVTIEDIKYVLSSYYQGTEYNPYGKGDENLRGKYRPIGINRNNFLGLTQIRPYVPAEIAPVMWIAEGSNAFNGMVPFYGNVTDTPSYLRDTGSRVSTDSFYWASRLIGALSDAHYLSTASSIERYQHGLSAGVTHLLYECDRAFLEEKPADICAFLGECNEKIAAYAKQATDDVLSRVLFEASNEMKNRYKRSDS